MRLRILLETLKDMYSPVKEYEGKDDGGDKRHYSVREELRIIAETLRDMYTPLK